VTTDPAVTVHRWRGEAAVQLASGALTTVFLPDLGMLGASLTHGDDEFVALPGGLPAYRAGRVTGVPLLAPWANRLAGWRYRAAGRRVGLEGLALPTDEHGLPIHGTMTARSGWGVKGVASSRTSTTLRVYFDYDDTQTDLFAAFPFPHRLTIAARLGGQALRLTVTLEAKDWPVPVSFGWHPYFRLPRIPRTTWALRLPARRHASLDGRGIPTGRFTPEAAEQAPLCDRVFDDLYALGDDRRFTLEGGGRRLVVTFDASYPFAQIYAPPGSPFVAIEPMTAPTNALVTGACPIVPPGERFRASFQVAVGET
jgi:aldose 1-epimerase